MAAKTLYASVGLCFVFFGAFVDARLTVIQLSKGTDIRTGAYVNVTWNLPQQLVLLTTSQNTIRLYCPKAAPGWRESDWNSNYIDEWPVGDQLRKPGGSIIAGPLMNLRLPTKTPCQFIYNLVKNVRDNSGGEFFFMQNEAMYPHLSLTNNTNEVKVTWLSGDDGSSNKQVLNINLANSQKSAQQIKGEATTYTSNMMCSAQASVVAPTWFRNPGYIYTATVSSLVPGTTYKYWVGAEEPLGDVMTFVAPKSNLASAATIIILGDMGVWGSDHIQAKEADNSPVPKVISQVTKYLNNTGADLLVHVGDLAYAQGRADLWDRFLYRITPIASRIPYHVVIGNHEYDHEVPSNNDPSNVLNGESYNPPWGNYGNDSNGECAVPVYHHFKTPTSPGSNSVFWYSHNLANMHLVYISTEHDLSPGSVQYQWLEQDLASVNTTSQPWTLVFGHRPLYNSQTNWASEQEVGKNLRERLDDLLQKYKVNVYAAGHYHSYQRTCPVYKEKCKGTLQYPNATVHITAGTAGANLSTAAYNSSVQWSAKTLIMHGFLAAQTFNNSHMKLTFTDINGTVRDTVWLKAFAPTTPPSTPPSTRPPMTPSASTRPPMTSDQATSTAPRPKARSQGTGTIVGAVIGSVALVILTVIGVAVYRRKRRNMSSTAHFTTTDQKHIFDDVDDIVNSDDSVEEENKC